jgi:hypothetical protein
MSIRKAEKVSILSFVIFERGQFSHYGFDALP